MPYPVTFKAEYVEKRSRLTTFFRLILAIPHLIAVFFYVLAAEVVVIIAWFALLFTGRYPKGMYDFVAGALRYSTRVCGYVLLLSDHYPPFSGDPATPYAVDLNIAPPKAEYNRLKVLFRLILLIPVYIISYAMQIVSQVGAFLAWFAIVILGRQPKGLQDMTVLGLSYQQRAYAYFGLLTEDWPPFTDETTGRSVEAAPAFGALAATPPAAGPESPTSVPPGGYASPEREAAFPSSATPLPTPEPQSAPPAVDEPPVSAAPPVDEPPASEAPTEVGRPAPEAPPAATPEPMPEPPSEPGPAAPSSGDPLGGAGPSAPTSGDPLGGTAPPAPPEPEPSPPSPGDWPDPPQESGPRSPGDWPDPEPEPEPEPERRADDDEDEPPPGPFGPSSTNP